MRESTRLIEWRREHPNWEWDALEADVQQRLDEPSKERVHYISASLISMSDRMMHRFAAYQGRRAFAAALVAGSTSSRGQAHMDEFDRMSRLASGC